MPINQVSIDPQALRDINRKEILTGGTLVRVTDIDCPLAVAVEPVEVVELVVPDVVELCPVDVVLDAATAAEGDKVLPEEEPDAELLAAEEVITASGVEIC